MEHFVVAFSFVVSVAALAGAILGYQATKKENERILSSQLRMAADSWWENLSEAEQAEWLDKPGGVVVVDAYLSRVSNP